MVQLTGYTVSDLERLNIFVRKSRTDFENCSYAIRVVDEVITNPDTPFAQLFIQLITLDVFAMMSDVIDTVRPVVNNLENCPAFMKMLGYNTEDNPDVSI